MLELRLLGQFDVREGGKRVAITARAGQSLMAFLALTAGTAHRREKLAGQFWPDTREENARGNLRRELWRIRKALASQQTSPSEYLVADDLTIAFNRDSDYWLDVTQLQQPLRADDATSELIHQLSLYQGELLPGFYDDWVALERERVQTVFEQKMGQLLERLVAVENWAAVMDWGERWIALGSTPEPAYRALMLAYGARGDMAKVASLYQRCVEALRNEIGVEPSAETRALYEGLAKGAQVPKRTAAVQPVGTVTFLFSDIEGSTRVLDKLGEQYATALADQRDIMRAAFAKWHGMEVGTQGDSFFAVFTRAADAVACAAEAQRALAAHEWPQGERVRVRMGLHTGEPLMSTTGYIGMEVHRAARIGDAGHGGQVLLSQATRELVLRDLPQGVSLRDLGEHRLKDMKYPTPLYQLIIDGLPADFPPLKTQFSRSDAPTPGEPPFKGLQYFDVADADLFFGRELLTEKLARRLRASHFLSVVVGASGSGKSSIVRAGLIPALHRDTVNRYDQIYIITPTAHPLEALATALTRDSESVTATATLMDDIARDPRALHLWLQRRMTDGGQTLLVVDQFEELFTLCRDEFEREAFIDNLLAAISPSLLKGEGRGSAAASALSSADAKGALTLILTLRADFYAHLAQYPELRDAVAQQQEYIGPMTSEELRRAIEEPARRAHWDFEPGLVDLILRDAGDEPGALPLLSHALLETWKRRAGHTLTLKGYHDAGGVRGAIAHTAESVYQSLAPDEQTVARNIFLRLTELGEGTEDTRRRARFDELTSSENFQLPTANSQPHLARAEWSPNHLITQFPSAASSAQNAEQVRAVLNILADARLVTLSEDTAEVAHEALIREWPTLREWLNQDREGLRLHRHLTEATQEWLLLEREAGALYRGARLSQAREWAALHPNALNERERAFLDASHEQAQREARERDEQQRRELVAARQLADEQRRRAEEQARANTRLRRRAVYLVGALLLAVLMMVTASAFAIQSNQNQQRAEDERRIAFVRELAGSANSNLDVDPERSILLALQAVKTSTEGGKPVLREAEEALHRAVQASRVQLTLAGHTDWVLSAAFSPDSKRILTTGQDRTVIIWDALSGNRLHALNGHQAPVNRGAFSPDGTRIATGSDDGTAKVWDVATGKELLTLTGHTKSVTWVAFSNDGTRVATASGDKTAKLWDALTGRELLALTGHEQAINSITFSPDGTQLATGSANGIVKIWNASSGKERLSWQAHRNIVSQVAYSPDGKRLATASWDSTAKVWDAATGQLAANLFGHASLVTGITFNPSGTRLATAETDGTARLWDAATGQPLITLAGHTNNTWSVAFSSDGTRAVTASRDKTVKVWDVSPSGGKEWATLVGHTGRVYALAIRPDGKRIATGSDDETVKVWDITTGQELFTLTDVTGGSFALAFSPDGTRLASVSDDGLKVWDVGADKHALMLSIPSDPLCNALAYSPDGSRVAAGMVDGRVKVWDSQKGSELLSLSGHSGCVQGMTFSPDGKRLATGSEDKTAKVWDAATGKLIVKLAHPDKIFRVTFSPDGMRLATAGGDGMLRLWDTASGQLVQALSGHATSMFSAAFSPDRAHLASSSADGIVKVWDISSLEHIPEPLTLYGNSAAVFNVAYTPDGTRLVTASRDKTARVYALSVQDLVGIARSRLTRTLTADECQKFLHVAQCP